MRRRGAIPGLLLPLALGLLVGGCGADEVTTGRGAGEPSEAVQRGEPSPYVNLSEVRDLLEPRVAVVAQALRGASLATEVDPQPVDHVRFAPRTGAEFDVLVFATPRAAREGLASVRETEVIRDGGSALRAANVVAAFPARPSENPTYRVARRRFQALAAACEGSGEDAELRRLCFEGATDLPGPPGEGTDPEELEPVGSTVRVEGLAYTPQTSRILNPALRPDGELVGGRRPGDDETWFGVFVRVCNEEGEPKVASSDLALVGAFGRVERPVDVPGNEAFAYEPRRLERNGCIPAPGSVGDRVAEGALVLFEVSYDFLEQRPVALQITGRSGARERVALDL
jgi:hypothetical protein